MYLIIQQIKGQQQQQQQQQVDYFLLFDVTKRSLMWTTNETDCVEITKIKGMI